MFTPEREKRYTVNDILQPPQFELTSDELQQTQEGGNSILLGATLRTATAYGRTATVKAGEDIRPALNSLKSAGGGTLVLLAGTHRPTYDIVVGDNLNILGEGVGVTIIDFGNAARQIKFGGSSSPRTTNVSIKNLTVTNMNDTNEGTIFFEYVDFAVVENVSASSNFGAGIEIYDCTEVVLRNVVCDDNVRGLELDGVGTSPSGASLTCYNVYCTNNDGAGFQLDLGNARYCKFYACRADGNGSDGFLQSASSGVYMSFIGCDATSNSGDGFDIRGQIVRLIGCTALFNTGEEVTTSNSDVVIVACDFGGSSITNSNEGVFAFANINSYTNNKKELELGNNVSGGTVSAGSVVVFAANANGHSFTTTSTQGDDLVYGVLIESTSNGGDGNILKEGKTTQLKVDGTTDIAVGDLLATFTTAGIAAKAVSGDMAFAIALEAYTNDDSNGVIDALLISPRKI